MIFSPTYCLYVQYSARKSSSRTDEAESQWSRTVGIEESSNGKIIHCDWKHHLAFVLFQGPTNAFDKLVQEMTENMTHVTLTSTTTLNTTTVSSSASSTASLVDLTVVQSSTSISSTLSLQSNATSRKEAKPRARRIYTYDDYLIHILKWPVSLIDELGKESWSLLRFLTFEPTLLELEPGAVYKDFLGENRYPVPLLELYSTFDEYEEITLPWLFEETFEEVKDRLSRRTIVNHSSLNRSNEVWRWMITN